jgi:transposase
VSINLLKNTYDIANHRITMKQLQKLIEYQISGKSKRWIAQSLGLSRNTVDNYLGYFRSEVGQDLSSLLNWSEEALYRLVKKSDLPTSFEALNLLFPLYAKELQKVGVTRMMLWEKHCLTTKNTVNYSRFCHYFRHWQSAQKVTMHIEHKAGDKLYIDFAGEKLYITDPQSGEKQAVEVFIATLGCSQYSYCQAVYSQKKADFLLALANALTYFGGVPQAIVPDNLKSAVTKPDRYEPDLNESIEDFASHYSTCIFPARSRKPKDKSLVERTVGILYTRIYAPINEQSFSSLSQLNEAIRQRLEIHNQMDFQGKNDSRKSLFEELERPVLKELPATRYELKAFRKAKVQHNCHVLLAEDKHYYSVPFRYVEQYVKLIYSAESVEIYYEHKRIATHERFRAKHQYTTLKEHLPAQHQYLMNWNPEFFEGQALKIGANTLLVIQQMLASRNYVEQGYKSCAGTIALAKKVGKERLENACERALVYDFVSIKILQSILDKDLDKVPINADYTPIIPLHPNIRGAANYQ